MKLLKLLPVFVILAIGACVNPCDTVQCLNDGACNDGTCICPEGFEGQYCENSTNPCDTITCLNNGTCVDGECLCPDGYEGEYCEALEATKFLGSFLVSEYCDGVQDAYTSEVTLGSSNNQVNISNMFNTGNAITATVVDSSLSIPNQTLDNFTIVGGGGYHSSGFALSFTVTGTTSSVNCTGNFIRQ